MSTKKCIAGLGLLLTSCTGISQGPTADLAIPATPEPVKEIRATPAAPAQRGEMGAWAWRAWVPPARQANGDMVEGHYVTISPYETPEAILQPATVIPRAPREEYKPKQQRQPGRAPIQGQYPGGGSAGYSPSIPVPPSPLSGLIGSPPIVPGYNPHAVYPQYDPQNLPPLAQPRHLTPGVPHDQ